MLKARQDKDSQNHIITVVLGADSNTQRYQETMDLINYSLKQI